MGRSAVLVVAGLVGFGLPGVAAAEFLVNGDFEATPFDSGWTNVVFPVGEQPVARSNPGLASGSTTAAYVRGLSGQAGVDWNTMYFGQNVAGLPLDWTLSLDFAALNATGASGRSSLRMMLGTAAGAGPRINFRVTSNANGTGDIQAYDNTTFQTILAGLVLYSTDGNGDGQLDRNDANDTVNVFHLELSGRYSTTPNTSVYDVRLYDAAGSLLGEKLNVAYFQDTQRPTSAPSVFHFTVQGSVDNFVVDNVSMVPEPASWLLLLPAAVGLAACRGRTKAASARP